MFGCYAFGSSYFAQGGLLNVEAPVPSNFDIEGSSVTAVQLSGINAPVVDITCTYVPEVDITGEWETH